MMRKALWAALAANVLLVSACSDPDPTPAGPGTVVTPPAAAPREHEIRGGRLHDTAVAGITATAADPVKLVEAVQADLRGRLGAMKSTDFVETHRNVTPAPRGARLAFVTLRQTVGGVPVEDTYLHVGMRHDASGARLVSSSYRLYENVQVDSRPTITKDRAIVIGQQSLRQRAPVAPSASELVIHTLGGRLQLAWKLTFPGAFKRAFVIAGGPEAGRVYAIDQRVFETTGTVSGSLVRGGAPGAAGVVETDPLPYTAVAGGGASVSADGAGAYAVTVPAGTALTATLSGRAAVIVDQDGAPVTGTGAAVENGVTDLALATTTEGGLAQTTSYYVVDQVRTFLEQNGADPAAFGAPLQTNTNLNDTCNAYYNPPARDINFFKSGGGCNNSAIDTVIAHEYGHFVDDLYGGIIDGGLSEGWGDLLACLWSQQPVVGFDLFPGGAIRSCQNDYVYPPGGGDEVHNLGQAWAGFGWDARQNLIAQLGPVDGDALARALILPSFASNSPDIPNSVREAFLRDDDDGDLTNHTPHWDALYAAALHHGLVFAIDPDLTSPAPVTDLAIASAQATQLGLTWTATGDDDATGTAASYELRWSTAPIDAGNFAAATLAATTAPQAAGTPEAVTITVPPETTIYVALVVRDEQFNTSTLSNVVSATTPAGTIVWQDGAEGDTSGWSTTGLWHVTTLHASEGTHAFWYGDEATGTYDTGVANSGDLISPVIDLSGASGPVLIVDQRINVEFDPFDLAQVIVTDVDDPSHQAAFPKETAFSNFAFVGRVVPLAGFDGKRVRLTFHFDTLDGVLNSTEGWFVDNLRILGSDSCAHGLCFPGGPLEPTCSTCVETVCAADAFCCTVAWDQACVNEAQSMCGTTCATCGNGTCEAGETPTTCPQDCQPDCAHDVCDPGVPLEPACDSCAATVCAADAFCCTTFWDRICVQESETLCGKQCDGCSHDFCNVGDPLAQDCDPCAASVCAFDSYCCTTAWDSRCVEEAANTCGLTCETCSHSVCSQGTPLEPSCDPCVTAVCATDPYCCNNTWDQRCIDQAQTTCGVTCSNFR